MKITFSLQLGVLFLLSACTTQVPTPSQAQIVFMAAQTVAANQSISHDKPSQQIMTEAQHTPTATMVPPGTPTSKPTSTQINIATQLAQPELKPKNNRIYSVSILDTGSLLVAIEFSPLPRQAYFAKVGQDQLSCDILPENPNRVYCHGFATGFGLIRLFRLYEEGVADPVFSSDLWIPGLPPTPEVNAAVHRTFPSATPPFWNTPIP